MDGPRHGNMKNRGVPPLRYMEQYVAQIVAEEIKHSPKTLRENHWRDLTQETKK